MKFSIKDFFSKCDLIRRKMLIWSHLLKRSLMEKFIFCAVSILEPVILAASVFVLHDELKFYNSIIFNYEECLNKVIHRVDKKGGLPLKPV